MSAYSEFGSLTFIWPSDHKKVWSSDLFGPDQFNYPKPQDQVTTVIQNPPRTPLPNKLLQLNRYKQTQHR